MNKSIHSKFYLVLLVVLNMGLVTQSLQAQVCFTPANGSPLSIGAQSPNSVISADFNGDGIADLATSNESTGNVSVMFGNGDGTFKADTTYSVVNNPYAIVVDDFNGDGKMDIGTSNLNTLSVLLNDGTGKFGAAIVTSAGSGSQNGISGDVNGDGITDFVMPDGYSNATISVVLGNGDGTFGSITKFSDGGNSTQSIIIRDFDGDGNVDLAIDNQNSNDVSIMKGDGNGNFTLFPGSPFAIGTTPTSIASDDFNGDGKLDLAVTNWSDNKIAISLGNGDGTFGAVTSYNVGTNPRWVTIGDLNGDGTPDLAIANQVTNDVTVLLGVGDGTFTPSINCCGNTVLTAGSSPYCVAMADYDGDGRLDMAVSNRASNDVYVFLNLASKQPPVATVQATTPLCLPGTLTLTGGPASLKTYSWSGPNSFTSSLQSPVVASPTTAAAGIYTLTVTDNAGCSGTDTVTVTIGSGVSLTLSPAADTTVCPGSSVQLTAGGASLYSWSPSTNLNCSTCANPLTNALTDSVTYFVTGSNAQGACSTTKHITLLIGNGGTAGTVAAVRDTICEGTPGNLSLSGNSSNTIQWQSSANNTDFTDITGATNVSSYRTTPLMETTWYRATVGTGNCSTLTNSLQLYVPIALTAYFSDSQTSANNLAFNSDSSSGNIRSYHWDFGDGQTSNEKNPSHVYSKDTTYYVCLTLYDGSNCSYTFCRYSDVTDAVQTFSAEGQWVVYPNPFNDRLVISGSQIGSRLESIELYDMLGRIVFNKNYHTLDETIILGLSDLSQGMYCMRITTTKGVYVQPVIKQQ